MPALHDPLRLARGVTAPALARHHVRSEIAALFTAGRLDDLVLLTSEVVTSAVEYSRAGAIEISVVGGTTFTRIEVSSPSEGWVRHSEPRANEPDEPGGWGLFLAEQLSDRWGVSESDHTVWFEFDHADDNFPGRVESNHSLVTITAEACERCGFPRTAGESHSCVEEKALFAESVNAVTGTFERFDESTARQAKSEDLRSGPDRRHSGTQIERTEERRHPVQWADGRAGAAVDNGGQRHDG